jgi:hypothetical protein
MPRALDPFRFLLIAVAGWMNQHQLLAIDYLREENRILREQLGGRRLRFTDDQRRRLATKAKGLGRKLLAEFATIVTPETLRAWPRQLIAQKIRWECQARAWAGAPPESMEANPQQWVIRRMRRSANPLKLSAKARVMAADGERALGLPN